MKKHTTIAVLIVLLPLVTAGVPSYKVSREDVERMSPNMQETFAGLQYLMNAYQIRQFVDLKNDEERAHWIDTFWKQRDPTPTTDKNEMEIEHNIRVRLARQYYRSKKWPGWDKRGEVFVRYGPPDYRSKVWGEVSVNRSMSPPREIWYYRNHDMLIAFENFGLTGEYIYAIDPLGAASKMSPEFAEFLIYDTQHSLTGRIPMDLLEYYSSEPYKAPPASLINPGQAAQYMASRERVLSDNIDALMDPDRVEMLPRDVSAVFQEDKVEKIAANFEITLKETPASYPFNFETKPLRFYFGIDQFRAGDTSNRVDVNIEVPVVVEGNAAFEETFHTEVIIWDAEYKEVSRKEKDILIRSQPDVESFANLIPTQIPLSLLRGYYRAAISVKGEKSGHESSYRTTFSCEPFAKRLSMSDVLFARRIDEATSPSVFTRGALEVVPHPLRAYSRSFPIPVYFEIYNLSFDLNGVASYTIEYKIVPHSNRKQGFWARFDAAQPVVSSKFQSTVMSDNDVQHLLIRTGNLHKGAYDFLITLTDDYSKAVTFTRGTFSLVD